MAKAPKPRAAPKTATKKAKPADDLTVTLDEFAALCGVTPETMRAHLKTAPVDADWMLVRGRPGVGYQIEAKGALAWYRTRKTAGASGPDDIRRRQLEEWRLQMLGDVGSDEGLNLTGKQRYEEYKAGEAEMDFLTKMGSLCRADEIEGAMMNAAIELRRHLQAIGPTIRKKFDLGREVEAAIETLIAERLTAFVTKIGAPADTDAG
jgi:predicted transcriptional regulator